MCVFMRVLITFLRASMKHVGVGLAVVDWRRWVCHGFMCNFVVAIVINVRSVITGGLLFCFHVCFDHAWGRRRLAAR